MDYLCKKSGIDTEKIYGYGREEFTHTSVAAQNANGITDAGMGIYLMAQLYHLDFLPICMEKYDLLIPDEAFETPMVQQLLEVLRSSAFRARLEALGVRGLAAFVSDFKRGIHGNRGDRRRFAGMLCGPGPGCLGCVGYRSGGSGGRLYRYFSGQYQHGIRHKTRHF